MSLRVFSFLMCVVVFASACGTSDAGRLKEARDSYLKDDFSKSETALYTPEVFKNSQNRLEHFYWLASIAMSEGQFEKAAYFLNRSRTIANQVRSSSGGFEWFSSDYKSNPIEYSTIHYMLVMSYSLLAEAGQTPAWSTPQIKDDKGAVMVDAQTHPARTYDAREISDYRQKARAELLAWDSFLQNLKATYPDQDFYKEDLWARLLASFIHGTSPDNNERRTAELLTQDAQKIFAKEFVKYPSATTNGDEIQKMIGSLKTRATAKANTDSLFVLEAGVMNAYQVKRYHLGLSTIFQNIEDPGLRRMMEEVGIRVLLATAPEFGLIVVGGALAGAVGGGNEDEDAPHYFTDAVDRSFGFEIRFPTITYPPSDTRVKLRLTSPGQAPTEYALPVISPLQEMVAHEMKSREQSEMFAKALRIGGQYVSILIPAVIAYRQADKNGNTLQKIGILAGYYIAKKSIDHANNPDLRSWSTLPQFIAADVISAKPGTYDAKVTLENRFGREEKALGTLHFGPPASLIVRQRIGNSSLLNHRDDEGKKSTTLH